MHAAAVTAFVIAALASLAAWITHAMNQIEPKEPRQ